MSNWSELADKYNSGKSIEPTKKSNLSKLREDAQKGEFKNSFYILDHPTKEQVFLNPEKFSFLAFFWSIIFYAYHKRWGGLILIIIGLGISNAIIESAFWGGTIACLAVQFYAGMLANQGKMKSLLSRGYEIVDVVDANNIDLAKARFAEKQKEKELQVAREVKSASNKTLNTEQTLASHEKQMKEDHLPTEQQLHTQNDASNSSSKQVSGIPDEIESFANLRDKGIITEEEFQRKKKELLDLEYEV